ncbi:MAG: hypothetical protein H7147_11145 [Frankiaceae bacterium]|nr:hypothetical protein [Arenimonas sp.]
MKTILMSILSVGFFAVAGVAMAAEPARIQYLNSGKVLRTDLPFSEAVRVDDIAVASHKS